MATVRDGIYLEDNRPNRSQFRVGRRSAVRSVIVVHTAESGTDRAGADPKAENVATFIRDRSSAGSYHLLGDSDSIIQLVSFENEAFQDGTGSNAWAIGISLAMNAADWSGLSFQRRDQLTTTAAQMAVIAARWLKGQGLDAPAARLLTKTQSNRSSASGFISHARRDPSRRSDPGAGFPWSEFFRTYEQLLGADDEVVTQGTLTRQLQGLIGATSDGIVGPQTIAALNRNWLGRETSFDTSVAASFANKPSVIEWVQRRLDAQEGLSVSVDGDFGPATETATIEVLGRGGVVAAESFLTLLES